MSKTDPRFVRWAREEDWVRVKEIWSYSFSDSPTFVDWVFSEYVRREELLVAGLHDEVFASLQLIDYPLASPGGQLNAKYVVGVNCLPEARGQGLTRLLLDCIHGPLAKELGVDLYLLMPFEADFYFDYDYVFGCLHARANLAFEDWPKEPRAKGRYKRWDLISQRKDMDRKDLFACLDGIYRAWQEPRFDYFQLRDERQWGAFIDDLALEEGQVAFWTPDGSDEAAGYLAYFVEGSTFSIREMAYASEAARQALSYFVASHRSQYERVFWSAPLDEPLTILRPRDKTGIQLYPFIMMRLQDISQAGSFALRMPERDLEFAVEGEPYRWLKGSREIQPLGTTAFSGPSLSLGHFQELIFSPVYRSAKESGVDALRFCFEGLSSHLNSYF